LTAVALIAAVWSCSLWGFAPFSVNEVYTGWVPSSSINALNYLEKGLPPNAVVSAWYPLVSHIDHRDQVYVWPTPFYASNWGLLNDTGARLPVASQVQYLLLPIPLSSADNPGVLNQIASSYRIVQSRAGFGLYERKASP
jgi:hypothetical protein